MTPAPRPRSSPPVPQSVRLVSSPKRTPTKAVSTAVDIPLYEQPLQPLIVCLPIARFETPARSCMTCTNRAQGTLLNRPRRCGPGPAPVGFSAQDNSVTEARLAPARTVNAGVKTAPVCPGSPGAADALQHSPADVAAHHLVRPVDLGGGGVGAAQRSHQVAAAGTDRRAPGRRRRSPARPARRWRRGKFLRQGRRPRGRARRSPPP